MINPALTDDDIAAAMGLFDAGLRDNPFCGIRGEIGALPHRRFGCEGAKGAMPSCPF